MQSPFKIFRKYQKQMMAALVVLAMFAFVLGDALSKLFGNRGDRGTGASAGDAVVTIGADNEKLTRIELNQLIARRRVANEFIAKAIAAARPLDTYDYFKINPDLARMQQQREVTQRQFRFTGQSEERDVVVGLLLRKEAERMGMVVSDDQVNKYIENTTQNRLSKEQFRTIVSGLQSMGSGGVDAPMLYSILRDELMAKVAQVQEVPNSPESPDNYWNFYRRLHESQQIEAVPVNTADFVDRIPDPDNKELLAFFDKGKNSYDHFDEEGHFKLGFKQPDKVRVQYLREKFADVQARVDKSNPVTEKDVLEYYEANKDMLYVDRPRIEADPTPTLPSTTIPLNPLVTPKSEGKQPAGPQLPTLPAVPSTDSKSGTKSDEPAKQDEKKSEEKKVEEKKKEEAPKAAPAPAKTEAAPKAAEKEAPKAAPAKPETKTEKTEKKTSRSHRRSRIVLAAYADEKDAKKAEAPKTAPAAEKKDAPKAAEKTADPAKAASPAKVEPKVEPKAEPKVEPKTDPKADGKTPAKAGDPAKAADPKISAAPVKKYRPLNDELKKEIREHLRKDRAFAELRAQAELAQTGFRKISNTLAKKFNPVRLKPADIPKLVEASQTELKQLATKMQMEYGETPLLDQREFQKLTGLGTAREPSVNFMEQTPTLVQRVFSTEETLVPGLAEEQSTSDMYIYWKVEYVAERVGELTDPEVKKQVVKAWKLQQAEPLARKRAEELAGILAKQGTKSATEVLAKTTVTGDAKSPQLTVMDIPPFTWLSTPSANSGMFPNRGRTVQMSEVPRIEKPGEDFMSSIYNLKTGDWGVAPAYDKSTFYVVKVVGRKEPSKEEFIKAPLFARDTDMMFMGPTPYDTLAQIDSTRLFQRFLDRLNDKYKVKWAEKKDGDIASAPQDSYDPEME